MKILNLVNTLNLEIGAGTTQRTIELSRNLILQGVDCTVLTLDTDGKDKKNNYPFKVVYLKSIFNRFFIPFPSFFKLSKEIKNSDCIHMIGHWSILNAYVYFIARFLNIPFVICPAGSFEIFGRSQLLKNIYNVLIGNKIVKDAKFIIAITKLERLNFLNRGISANKVIVIPNAIELEKSNISVNKSIFRKKFSLSNKKIILFMGRLNYIKGIDLLVDAFIRSNLSKLKYQLVIAGRDEGCLSYLEHSISKFKINKSIKYIGFLNADDKKLAYKSSFLLVVPSRSEAMSLVAIEAMSYGLPVMLTDKCGFNDVKKINSLFIAKANSNSLSKNLVSILKEKNFADIYKVEFKKIADTYSWENLICNYISLFNKSRQ